MKTLAISMLTAAAVFAQATSPAPATTPAGTKLEKKARKHAKKHNKKSMTDTTAAPAVK